VPCPLSVFAAVVSYSQSGHVRIWDEATGDPVGNPLAIVTTDSMQSPPAGLGSGTSSAPLVSVIG
jgi:hypothetical protein